MTDVEKLLKREDVPTEDKFNYVYNKYKEKIKNRAAAFTGLRFYNTEDIEVIKEKLRKLDKNEK